MKRVFTALLLLLTMPAWAQKWEAGFNVGLLKGIGVNKWLPPSISFYGPATATYNFRIARNWHQWQFGASVDIITLNGGETVGPLLDQLYFDGVISLSAYNSYDHSQQAISINAFPVEVFANRKLRKKGIVPYVGASLGYVFAHMPALDLPAGYGHDAESYNGKTLGLQVGASYKASRRIGVNAEVKLHDMILNIYGDNSGLHSITATAGIRYYLYAHHLPLR